LTIRLVHYGHPHLPALSSAPSSMISRSLWFTGQAFDGNASRPKARTSLIDVWPLDRENEL
jgi:hypothetical protein